MRERGALTGLVVAALLVSGCGLTRLWNLPPRIPDCPGFLVPTGEIPGDFVVSQRMRVTSGSVNAGLDLAVQKSGDELVVVGFTILGAKAFVLTQRGTRVEVRDLLGRASPLPPRNVLRDIHRIEFAALQPEPFYESATQAIRDGTRITEFWWEGRLTSRIFERVRGRPEGVVSVEFPETPGGEIHLHNGWCDYDAVVVTVSDSRRPGD